MFQSIDHSVRRNQIDRHRGEHDVLNYFGKNTTHAKHRGFAESRIMNHANNEFTTSINHFRNE